MIETTVGWWSIAKLIGLQRSVKVPHVAQGGLMTMQKRDRETNRIRKAINRDRRAAFMMGISLQEYHAIALYLSGQSKPGATRGKFTIK